MKKNKIKNPSKKIMFLIGSLSAGGIATSVMRLAEILKDKVEIDLVVLSGRVKDVYVPENLFKRIIYIDKNGFFRFYQIIRALKVFKKYLSALNNKYYDFTIAFGEIPGLLGVLGKWMGRYRFISSIRTDWEYEFRHRANNSKIKFIVYYILSWLIYHSADHIVPVTQEVAERAQKMFNIKPNRMTYIYNFFDWQKLHLLSLQPLSSDEELLFKTGEKTFVAMGRLHPQKGFDILLRAFAEIRKKGYNVNLVIIGEGGEKEKLLNIAKRMNIINSTFFVGYKSNPYRLLKNADAFILSSRWEGIANSLVEALICKVPIISTSCPAGPREILTTKTGKQLGILVESENVSALEDAMIELFEKNGNSITALNNDELLVKSRLIEMEKNFVTERWIQLFN